MILARSGDGAPPRLGCSEKLAIGLEVGPGIDRTGCSRHFIGEFPKMLVKLEATCGSVSLQWNVA